MNKLLKSAAPLYLGFAISIFGNLHFFNWQFWAILVPFFVIAKATKFNNDDV